MAARGITISVYDALLIFYRNAAVRAGGVLRLSTPGYREAARLTGIDRLTAKRAYLFGWSGAGKPALRDVLVSEEMQAHVERERIASETQRLTKQGKARELEQLKEEQRKAFRDIVKMRAALGELAKNAVAGAGTLLAMARNLQPGLDQLTKDLSGMLGGKDPKTGQILPMPVGAKPLGNKDKIEIMKAASTLIKNMGLMSKYAAELEKETMGLPPVPELKEDGDGATTPQQFIQQLEEFLAAVKEGEDCYEKIDDENDALLN